MGSEMCIRDSDHAEEAKRQVLAAFKLSDSAPKETELVLKRIT